MLHAKIQDNMTSSSGGNAYQNFLPHMAEAAILVSTIFAKFMFPFPKEAPRKICFDWSSG